MQGEGTVVSEGVWGSGDTAPPLNLGTRWGERSGSRLGRVTAREKVAFIWRMGSSGSQEDAVGTFWQSDVIVSTRFLAFQSCSLKFLARAHVHT